MSMTFYYLTYNRNRRSVFDLSYFCSLMKWNTTSCTKRLTWSVTDGGISKNDPYKSYRPSKNINLSIFCFFENRAIFEIFLGEKLRGEVMAGIFWNFAWAPHLRFLILSQNILAVFWILRVLYLKISTLFSVFWGHSRQDQLLI